MKTTRRQFLQQSTLAAAAWAPTLARPSAPGANEEIRVGVVGLGGRGRGAHIPGFQNQKGVKVVAVCDADRERMSATAGAIKSQYGHEVRQHLDMREMFDREDIDVIANATQNYWHGLGTIWACQAGKHVYVEKPLSHYIWEGRQMVLAARRYNRMVQVGTQHRSQQSIAQAIQWLREGHLGKIRHVMAFANKPRSSCGKRQTPLPIPETVDYDLWCGPAQKRPLYRDRLQYDCSFDWNTGDGESCNQGVHEIDVARWCLGETRLPARVMGMGGRFVFDDACDVPNTQIIYYDYPGAPVLYEVRNLTRSRFSQAVPTFRHERVGVVAVCEGGSVSFYRGLAWDTHGRVIRKFEGGGDHFVNFVEALRSGRREHLNAEVEQGHLSTAVCHAGNISCRVGMPASEAAQRDALRDIPLWTEMHERLISHLEAHQIDPNTLTLGPWLELDRDRECFVNHPEANRLARGFYREPYVWRQLEAAAL